MNSMKKIILAPYSGAGLNHGNGSNEAPAKIIEALQEIYTNEDFVPLSITVDEQNIAQSHQNIQETTANEKNIVLIGGDHSITCPSVKGVRQHTDCQFIVFDAHADLMDDFDPPTHEDYLRVLIEKHIDAQDVTIIGLRNLDEKESKYLKEKNITYYTMKDVFAKSIQEVMKEVLEKVTKPVYVSVDIDVVDPVEAIGTGYTEHGGMSSRELLYALQQLKENTSIIAADVVEVNPSKDVNNITVSLGAKIVSELV